MNNLVISFGWVPIQGSQGTPYRFPEAATKYLRERYGTPAIYRWLVQRDQRRCVYIGETENLVRRLVHYLRPGPTQATNIRLRAYLDEEYALGTSISFEALVFEPFSINGRQYSSADLGTKEVRCMLENLLITQVPMEIEKLNRLDSLPGKVIAKAPGILNLGLEPGEAKAIALKALEALQKPGNTHET